MRLVPLVLLCLSILGAGPSAAVFQMKGSVPGFLPEPQNLPVPATMEMNGDPLSPELVVTDCQVGYCSVGMASVGTSAVEWIYFDDWNEPPTRVIYLDVDSDGLLDALLQKDSFVITVGWSPAAAAPDQAGRHDDHASVRAVPNPNQNGCQLVFSLTQPGPVSVEIFDPSGRRIREIISGDLAAGRYEPMWDGSDESGNHAPAGVYFARIKTPDGERAIKLVLTR